MFPVRVKGGETKKLKYQLPHRSDQGILKSTQIRVGFGVKLLGGFGSWGFSLFGPNPTPINHWIFFSYAAGFDRRKTTTADLNHRDGKQPVRMKAVVYALSPFQQKVMTGLWKDLPSKIHHKISENWISATLLLGPLIGVHTYVKNYQEKEKLAHRY